jgi:myo-inositol-1(or 4)-monophosphatase
VTGFGYNHDAAWKQNIQFFEHFTDVSRGVRRLGAAAVDLCHVGLGNADAYWEYSLSPWDCAAGVLMVQEAGGMVTTMDGRPFTVWERSILASNGALHGELLAVMKAPTEALALQPEGPARC